MNPKFHPAGVGLILLALFADAATSNIEEKRFFRVPSPSSQAEVIFYSSALATAFGAVAVVVTGEFFAALDHSIANPVVVPLLASAAVCGYFSVTFVLLLIKHFGATNTEIVKSLRKARSAFPLDLPPCAVCATPGCSIDGCFLPAIRPSGRRFFR